MIYLLKHIFLSLWDHRYLFYALSYTLIPLYLFVAEVVPALSLGILDWLLCSFDISPLLFFVCF